MHKLCDKRIPEYVRLRHHNLHFSANVSGHFLYIYFIVGKAVVFIEFTQAFGVILVVASGTSRSNATTRSLGSATMSTSPPERNKDTEDPNPPPGTHSPTPRRPIYQTETTGNYWADVREAFKVQSSSSTLPVSRRCCHCFCC
jgi:hypothetical protein